MIETLISVAAVVAGTAMMWYWVVKPPGVGGTRLSRESLDASIQRRECDLGMCQHMVNGTHPKLMVTQDGRRYWALPGLMWEEGTPCPIDRSAPTADAN